MQGKAPPKSPGSVRTSSHRAVMATDLDGTLAVGGVIQKEDRMAADRLRSHGISLLVATGRNLFSLERIKDFWDFVDVLIFSSGAGLQNGPDAVPLERGRLSPDDVRRITALLGAAGEDYCLLNPVPDSHYFRWRRFRRSNPDFDKRMDIYQEWALPDSGEVQASSQVLVIRPPGAPAIERLIDALSDWSVFHSASPIDGESRWLEIFPPGLNKGSAVSAWARENGLTADDFFALGNDYNDDSMLAWAAHARVVAGAPVDMAQKYPILPPAGNGGFSAAVDEAISIFTRH